MSEAFDVETIKSLGSQVLSYAIIIGSFALKVPQILKVWQSGSAEGLAISMFLFEVLAFTVSICYHFRMGYAFSTYGEGVFILAQLYVLIYLILSIRNQFWVPKSLVMISLYFLTLGAALTEFFPMEIVAFLQSCNVLFGIASRLPQIKTNFKNKSTGQLSGLMIFLNFGGSVARILTTLQDVGDVVVLAGYSASAFLGFILLVQIVIYPGEAAPKKKTQ
mmetsp:Transcript_39798/g.61182  ORF Transcript_39798/g.61182 Transcript_39798/m.61182 type:complete len:220 (-) Transcript_39798:109-768(-)